MPAFVPSALDTPFGGFRLSKVRRSSCPSSRNASKPRSRQCCPLATAAMPTPRSFSSSDTSAQSNEEGVSVEHRNVPAAHRGLHDALYPSSAEDEHGSASTTDGKTFQDETGIAPHSVKSFLAMSENLSAKVSGVYGILDSTGDLVYVGLSRNVALNVRSHLAAFGSATVAGVRIRTFSFPRRSEMESVRDSWIAAHGGAPSGNRDAAAEEMWKMSLTSRAPGKGEGPPLMTTAERAAFEEKKFKLRKAMADPSLVDELEAADRAEASELNSSSSTDGSIHPAPAIKVTDASSRSRDLRNAVEQDDWSAEIDAQTAEVLSSNAGYAGSGPQFDRQTTAGVDTDEVVSPFVGVAGDGLSARPDQSPVSTEDVTVSSVDAVLNEVRPYLISDGGNISVVSVVPSESDRQQGATVNLMLEGACGTCPSSTMTMRLGVERVLRENFGDAVGEIVALNSPFSARESGISVEACDAVLDEVRPILSGLGNCSVVTKSVSGGNIALQYNGPESLSYAIEHMLREKFPGVTSVSF